jgi:hypothetical protein
VVPLRAPAIDVLFRPEQEHGFSGEDDVFVPMARGHSKVDGSLWPEQSALLYPEDHLVVAAAAGGVNARVLLQHGRDSQGIPVQLAYQALLPALTGKAVGTAENGAARQSSPVSCKTKAWV